MRSSPAWDDDPAIDRANAEAIDHINGAQPFLIDLKPAGEALGRLADSDILHAGPPLAGWNEACGALRGAVIGTLLLNGAASKREEAKEAAASGAWRLRPAGDVNALCTFGGVITNSTPVFEIENRAAGIRTFAVINEGRGAALRYGSGAPETLARLRWLHGEFAEVLGLAIRRLDGIDLLAILEQALHMGDDGHSRQKAASALFVGRVAAAIVEVAPAREAARALAFLASNDFSFLPLAMAAAKSAMIAAQGIAKSTIVTGIAFNGVRSGIVVSGLPQRWCTAPVPPIRGRYFGGFGADDAGPVIGDSEIVETMGLGAFAMAAAPALARYVGGTVEQACQLTEEMYRITVTEHVRLTIPALGFRGVPLGIDVRKVLAHRIAPVFNTGIAHKNPDVGQIGAGYGRVSLACFEQAARALGLKLA